MRACVTCGFEPLSDLEAFDLYILVACQNRHALESAEAMSSDHTVKG